MHSSDAHPEPAVPTQKLLHKLPLKQHVTELVGQDRKLSTWGDKRLQTANMSVEVYCTIQALHSDTAEWVGHNRTCHTTVALTCGGSEPALRTLTQIVHSYKRYAYILYCHTVTDHDTLDTRQVKVHEISLQT